MPTPLCAPRPGARWSPSPPWSARRSGTRTPGSPVSSATRPQYVHEVLSAEAGRPVIVKVETVNPIGAFKGRGTWTGLRALLERGAVGEGRPVVVASTGNFGQGIAYAARAHGVPAIVYADRRRTPLKLDRIRRFGATVVLLGAISTRLAGGPGAGARRGADVPARRRRARHRGRQRDARRRADRYGRAGRPPVAGQCLRPGGQRAH